jgi:hypothetical protein
MRNLIWPNPARGHTAAHKAFAIQGSTEFGGVVEYLDMCAGALNTIDHGQFWRFSNKLLPRPDIGPDVAMLEATGEYKINYAPAGRLGLDVIAQYHDSLPFVGLVVMFYDTPSRLPLPWSESRSEEIVAMTLLTLSDASRRAMGHSRPADQSPLGAWSWYEPTCGWFRGGSINYDGWSISLG